MVKANTLEENMNEEADPNSPSPLKIKTLNRKETVLMDNSLANQGQIYLSEKI